MEEMTLREVCNSAEVTRRAVQGYEKAGLVTASGKNERVICFMICTHWKESNE